jgi:hypothetical protein
MCATAASSSRLLPLLDVIETAVAAPSSPMVIAKRDPPRSPMRSEIFGYGIIVCVDGMGAGALQPEISPAALEAVAVAGSNNPTDKAMRITGRIGHSCLVTML